MSWLDGMKEALIGYVISHGALVKESASQRSSGQRIYSGWQEDGWDDATQDETPALTIHMRHCAVDLARSCWEDSDWQDFNGTFAEPPWEQCSGTDAVVDLHLRSGAGPPLAAVHRRPGRADPRDHRPI